MSASTALSLAFRTPLAGAILVATGKTAVSEMHGLGRHMPFTMYASLIGSLGIIGLPPAGGIGSKWFLMLGTLEAGQQALLAVLIASSLYILARLLVPGGGHG